MDKAFFFFRAKRKSRSGLFLYGIYKPSCERRLMPMDGFWTEYGYTGIMPDGTEQEFVSADEYAQAYRETEESR